MAAPPRQPPNMEQFEAYFQRADLDRDGRISGAEAVTFFQGSGLPKNVLAQIWQYSDAKNAGFLGREEFYNALRLVTVAQSGRQLTREIVMAALGGPAASKIPAPQIKVAAASPLGPTPSRPQSNSMMPPPQIVSRPPLAPGFPGASAQVLPVVGVTQQYNRPETMRPMHTPPPTQTISQGVPGGTNVLGATATFATSVPFQSTQGLPRGGNIVNPRPPSMANPNISSDWFSSQLGGALSDGSSPPITGQVANFAAKQDGFASAYSGPTNPSAVKSPVSISQSASLPPKPPVPTSLSPQPSDNASKILVVTNNGFSSDSTFRGDAFSIAQEKQDTSSSSFSSNKIPVNSNVASLTMGFQTPARPVQSLSPSTSTELSFSFPILPTQSPVKPNQPQAVPSSPALSPPAVAGTIPTSVAQSQWPKMTKSDIQKYLKVFVEVDKDRDGKITGEQARNLFLSWRLPREVLKQVWDLSDQDGDSMLSVREFCIALYLMERYREGRPLPSNVPNNIMFDDAFLQATGQPYSNYGGSAWQSARGFPQQGMPVARPVTSAEMSKPHQQAQGPTQIDNQVQPVQKKSAVPVLEKHLVDQLSNDEQSMLNSKLKEASEADKKVENLEKEILEAKEKIEFYRVKMQELVLYKSRCDTRLVEVLEKASSNKHEYEILAKKYEEKCRQVGDVASKLTIEEATFREIQERKLKLYNAIVKLDAGSTDDSLKVQAEKIQSDLEELVRSLNDRCKQYGLRAKPTTLVELPFGWQPGVQEGTADWDEDWDKFQEEGFVLVKELTVDVQNIIAGPKSKSPSVSSGTHVKDELFSANLSEDSNGKLEKNSIINEKEVKIELAKIPNEHNLERSPPGSPLGKEDASPTSLHGKGSTAPNSPQGKETSDVLSPKFDSLSFRMDDTSPQAKDHHSEQGDIQFDKVDDKHSDNLSWGPTFDTHEDSESMWNFRPADKVGNENKFEDSFFGAGDFGLNPIKTGTSTNAFDDGKDKSLFFSDSIPTTPPVNDFGNEKNSFFADSVPATPFYNSVFSPRFNDPPGIGSPSVASDFGKEKSFFADSVPGTPHYNSVFSPKFSEGTDTSFNSFGRFDSFNAQGSMSRFDSFNAQGSMSRFDSFNAQGSGMSRFDSFNVQPSLSRFDSISSTATSDAGGFFAQSENFQRFDSMRSTRDSDHSHGFLSFDDSDPFGSGPFKPLDSQNTPKHSSDRWSAF